MRGPPSQRPPHSSASPTPRDHAGGGDCDGLLAEDAARGTPPRKGGRASSGGCGGETVLTVGQAISSRFRRLLSQPSSTAPSSAPNGAGSPSTHHHLHHHSHHHHGHRAPEHHHANAAGMPRGSRTDGVADGSSTAVIQHQQQQQQQCPPEHVPGSTGDVPAGQQQQHLHYHRKRKERQESISLSQDRKVIRSNSEERPVVELEVKVSVSGIEVDDRVGKSAESNGIVREIVSADVREQKKTKGGSGGGNNSILRRVSSHEDVTTARQNCNNQLHNHIQQQHNGKGPIVIINGKDKDEKKGSGNLKGSGKSFLQELIGGDAPLLAPRSFPQPLHEHNSSPSSNSTSIINPSAKEDDASSVTHHSPSSSTRVGSPSPPGTSPVQPLPQGTVGATSPAVSTPFFFLPTPVGEEEEEHERRRSSERFASFPRASTPRGGKREGGSRPRESRRPRRQRAPKVWKDVADGDGGGGSSSSKENEEDDSAHEENVSVRDFDKEALSSTKGHLSPQYPKYTSQQQPSPPELSVPSALSTAVDAKAEETVHSFMQLHPQSSPIPTNLDEDNNAVEESEVLQEKDSEVGGEKGSGSSASSPTSSPSSSSSSPSTSPTSPSTTSSTPDDRIPPSSSNPTLPSPSSVSVAQLDLASLLRRMDTTEEPLTSRGPWLGGAQVHGGNDEDFSTREMRYFDHGEVTRRAGEREEDEEGHVVPLSPRNSMVLTRGAGRCGAYLDPNVPPSPPTEHHLPHLKRLPDPLASESPATILTKQVSRQINSLKKKIKRHEEEFEGQFGYRPSHADKLANRDVKKWISELGKLRKDLRQMKEDPHSPMLSSAKTLGMTFSAAGRDALKDADGKTTKMEDTLGEVQKRLTEKRVASGRPEELEALTREQLQDEKLALQKALLHLESLHGRPSSREERDLVRPLYDRYRMLKRMVIRSGPSKLKDSVTELATIHEHEAMDFTPQSQSEDVPDEIRVPGMKDETLSMVGLVPSASSGISGDLDKVEDRKVPDIGENLHALPLIELLGVQREAREEKKRLRRAMREFEEEFALTSGRRATKDERPPALEQTAILYKRTRAKLRLLEALVAKHTGGITNTSPLDE